MTNTREFSKNGLSDLIDGEIWSQIDHVSDHGLVTYTFVGRDYDGTFWIGEYKYDGEWGIDKDEWPETTTLFEAELYSYTTTGWRAIKDEV